jgi:hypothetical protein
LKCRSQCGVRFEAGREQGAHQRPLCLDDASGKVEQRRPDVIIPAAVPGQRELNLVERIRQGLELSLEKHAVPGRLVAPKFIRHDRRSGGDAAKLGGQF